MKIKNTWVRAIVIVICILISVVGSMSIALLAVLQSTGVYSGSSASTSTQLYNDAKERTAQLLLYENNPTNEDAYQGSILEDQGIRFGVIKTDNGALTDDMLADSSRYVYSTLEEADYKDVDQLDTCLLEWGAMTTSVPVEYFYEDPQVIQGQEYMGEEQVTGFVYDDLSGSLYICVGDRYFSTVAFTASEEEIKEWKSNVVSLQYETRKQGNQTLLKVGNSYYSTYSGSDYLEFSLDGGYDYAVATKDVASCSDDNGINGVTYDEGWIDGLNQYSAEELYVTGGNKADSTMQTYAVVFADANGLANRAASMNRYDYFAQANFVESISESGRIIIPFVIVACLVVGVLLFAILIQSAGCRADHDEVTPRTIDELPMDVFTVLTVMGVGIGVILFCAFSKCSGSSAIVLMCIVVALVAWLIIAWAMSLSVNRKLHRVGKKSLIGRLVIFIIHSQLNAQQKATLTQIKGPVWLVFGIFVVLEIIGVAVFCESAFTAMFWVLWLVEKIIFALLLGKILKQYASLRIAAQKIALGEIEYQVDTSKMFPGLNAHGNDLNHIAEGLQNAVADRMRSERMKTELITNVSHDIKTPLTSIINYVDLLRKEDLDNENARQYLEVLSRQSDRLKKLIEDLLEASKASTGNLKMDFERLHVGVILTQVIGEFEERLLEKGITLRVQDADSDTEILADVRHLWRVFDNLMTNINKYAQEQTRAYINLKEEDGYVVITFLNTSKEELNISAEELVERFVRGDESRNTEGSGLGLSIARSLTELMKGQMQLAIEGDLFKVILKFPMALPEGKQ
ncbi:sensor histidine kinase [Eubacterium oxidoreducens]|uniref:histidine kinase n=1 Tax=Eubacterium oxidoreducens TaxID=1732 RepID=A0A1G6CDK8_EUBOX|nr:HAMP domain-containing sensor histidine kinase [Eubacterium oxidoreducens]SDB30959.1 Signal transduction histidine kinase [Eubacterium oxidoreducens]